MVAPLAAAASRDVAFVVLVSSLGVTAGEQDLERIRRQMTADGHDAAAVAEAVALRRLAHDVVRGRRSAREYDVALATVRGRPWARQPGFVVGPAGRDYWWTWYRSKIDLDPTVALRAVRVPALVIFGESDLVVDAARNAPLMEAALRAGGNRDVTVRIFPRADHNLRIPGGRQPDGRFDFARVAPGFLALMTEWIRRH